MIRKYGALVLLIVLMLVIVLMAGSKLAGPDNSAARYAWVCGAAALGLLTGMVTGASSQVGIGEKFFTLLSGGILVPLFGGVVTLMQFRQGAREENTYVGEHLATKTTIVVFPAGVEVLHPIWVLGAFFALYGGSAILGVLLGVLLREAGFPIKVMGSN